MNTKSGNPLFIFDLDDTLCHTTRDLAGDMKLLPQLRLLRGLRSVLQCVKPYSVLLTSGNVEQLAQKIEHLQLRSLFTEGHVTQNSLEKEMKLRALVAAAKVHPERVVVVGDRIDHEIRFGNKLGCTTVRMKVAGGKYNEMLPESGFDLPVYVARDAAELAEILEQYL